MNLFIAFATRQSLATCLPSVIVFCGFVLRVGFSQLMMHTDTNEENLALFLKLLDNALQHEVSPPSFPLSLPSLFLFLWCVVGTIT